MVTQEMVTQEMVTQEMVTQEMVTQEMVTQEMVTQERKIHQKKGNKIPYLLFVSRLHELTKATQIIDQFNEDGRNSFNRGLHNRHRNPD
jgi:hypothetical protein